MGSDYAERTWSSVLSLPSGGETVRRGTPAMDRVRAYADAADAALIAWSGDGDRRAFDEIVTRHGPFALRVAARLVPDPATAEDLAQESMVRAWAQARTFDPRRARLTTWLYRIVVNLCIDYRRQMRPEALPEGFDVVDPTSGADERMEENERRTALAGALSELPARQRAAIALVYDEGISGAEAARILGASAKAVERLLARARAQLRTRLNPEPAQPGTAGKDVRGKEVGK
jgi:RNA polymerase sigma-70 factor (ECF subfamily)